MHLPSTAHNLNRHSNKNSDDDVCRQWPLHHDCCLADSNSTTTLNFRAGQIWGKMCILESAAHSVISSHTAQGQQTQMSTKSSTLCTLDQFYINKYLLCQLFLASHFLKIILLYFICTSLSFLSKKKLFVENHSEISTQSNLEKLLWKVSCLILNKDVDSVHHKGRTRPHTRDDTNWRIHVPPTGGSSYTAQIKSYPVSSP